MLVLQCIMSQNNNITLYQKMLSYKPFAFIKTNEMLLRSLLIKCPRNPFNSTARTCTHQVNSPQTESTASDWKAIYNLPAIRLLGGLNKLKIYQSALTAAGVPTLMALEITNIVPADTTQLFAVLGITGTISLCIVSLFSTKVIGFVYVNAVQRKIKFSYINFWGRRINQEVTLDEIVSSDEKRLFDTYTVIKTNSTSGSLKLLSFGNVSDPNVFHAIFGDI